MRTSALQFMDIAEGELRREVQDVSLLRIQGLLQLAVTTSTLASDPHREKLSCALEQHNLIQHLYAVENAGEGHGESAACRATQGLKGVEALTLDYSVRMRV